MTIAHRLRVWRHRVRSLVRRDAVEGELARELAFHFDRLVEEHAAAGLPPDEARRAAQRALGNAALIAEQCRDERRVSWLFDLRQDVLCGLRMLRKAPVFTAVAAASLALGIGANAAILGVIDATLLGRTPFPDDRRLVVIRTAPLANPLQTSNASLPDYVAWKDRIQAFEAMGASLADQRDFGAEGDRIPAERISGQAFTPGLFSTLGIPPLVGRVFTDEEAAIDRPARVIVISHRLWQRRFGADPGILGKPVRLNGIAMSIIGVMPPQFLYPNENADYWLPLALNRTQLQGSARYYVVTARLARGATRQQAQDEVSAAAAQLARDFPDRHAGWGARVEPLRDALFGWTKQPLLTLEAAVGLVLLIACANVAGLQLARAAGRGPELALRMALGAGRGRLIRQLLAESLVLSLFGGVLGVMVAWGGLAIVRGMRPPPAGFGIQGVALNVRMLAVMALLSVATGLASGVMPAVACSPRNLRSAFGRMGSGTGSPARVRRVRGTLVATQIAIALVLTIGAGLLVTSLLRLAGRELNFDPVGLLTFDYRIPGFEYAHPIGSYQGYPYFEIRPSPAQTLARIHDRLRRVPGAESVAGIAFPHLHSLIVPAMSVSRPAPAAGPDRIRLTASYFLVTPGYFATVRTPLVRGRDVDARDTVDTPWVAIVNETMARRLWPGEDPIGRSVTLDIVPDEQPREVVGIVRDVPVRREQTDPEPVIYASYLQQPSRYRGPWANMFGQMTFVVRHEVDLAALVPAVRRAVAEIDPDRPLANIGPIGQWIDVPLRRRRTYALAVGVFACAATLLAAVGVYGLMAFSVTQRTREIGIRMALGAGVRDVIAMVGRHALILVGAGLAFGLLAASALMRQIAAQLWGVAPTDPTTFAAVSLMVALVALLACVIPLRRAMSVDPTLALKCE